MISVAINRIRDAIGGADQNPKRQRGVIVNRRGHCEQTVCLRTHSLTLGALIWYATRVMLRHFAVSQAAETVTDPDQPPITARGMLIAMCAVRLPTVSRNPQGNDVA